MSRAPSQRTVGIAIGVTAVLTLFHFTDNALNLDTYPGPSWQPEWFEWVVAAAWPIYTAIGLAAYIAYGRGRQPLASLLLAAYSFVGLVSLGHFLTAAPSELTTRGLVSVFVDAAAGSIVLAVAVWSYVAWRGRAAATGGEPLSGGSAGAR